MKNSPYLWVLAATLLAASLGCQPAATEAPSTPSEETKPADSEASQNGDSAGSGGGGQEVGNGKSAGEAGEKEVAAKEYLIDVRSQEEWDGGHLEDAVHIPHTEITQKISEVTTDKSAKLVLY